MKVQTSGVSGGLMSFIKTITGRDLICILSGMVLMAIIL